MHVYAIQSFDKTFKETEKFIVEKKAKNLSERVIRPSSLVSFQDSLICETRKTNVFFYKPFENAEYDLYI